MVEIVQNTIAQSEGILPPFFVIVVGAGSHSNNFKAFLKYFVIVSLEQGLWGWSKPLMNCNGLKVRPKA